MTKLTLSMDEEVVVAAKRIAKRHKQSVSRMLADMVKAMAAQEGRPPAAVPPDSVAARLTGAIRLPSGVTADDARYEALRSKYGVRAP